MPRTIVIDNIVRSSLFIADMHSGSYYALAGENPIRSKTGSYHPADRNKGQEEIYSRWLNMQEKMEEFQVDTVFLDGDICDGCNPKERGKGEMTTDMDIQLNMAIDLLEPVVENKVVHTFSGSPYHQSIDFSTHNALATRLESVAKSSTYHGVIGNLRMKPSKKVFNVAHKASNAMLYTSTMLDREHIYMKYAEAMGKLPKIDYVFRAHLHHYRHLDFGFMHVLQIPCWKAWYPIKKSTRLYGRMQPDIGFVIVLIDDEEHSFVIEFIWNAPHIVDELVDG